MKMLNDAKIAEIEKPEKPIHLDEIQRKIVALGEGRYSIRSGAGSGKTACLTERIKHLVNSGEREYDILALTFTRDAANEMRMRLDGIDVDCRTIHSYALEILRNEMYRYNREMCPFQVVTGAKRRIILRKAIDSVGIDDIEIGAISLAISRAKSFMSDSTGDYEIDEVWRLYEAEKRKHKLIDFDDFVPMAIDILKKSPTARRYYSKKWILVDEAHDTGFAQHKLIELLETGNLFLISSPEQSIYSWRTAAPELIVDIKKRYPDIREIELQTNYRSGDGIISAANSLIEKAKWRSLKMKGTDKSGDCRYFGHFENLSDEAQYISARIRNESSAILYRTNWYSLELELALRQAGIDYRILGNLSFFNLFEIADIIAYLKLVDSNLEDKESFLRIFNKPNRYLGNKWRAECEDSLSDGKSTVEILQSTFRTADNREYHFWGKNQKRLLSELLALQCMKSPAMAISYIRTKMGYDEWLRKERIGNDEDDDLDIYAALDEFERRASQYEDVKSFLEDCFEQDESDSGIVLGTIHRAKGLEWDNVHIAGVTENLLPHFRSRDVEEERRLLYVAITRARDHAEITSSFHKQFKNPSRFLNEISWEGEI
jgi:DNA helicase-2/ATP-dependent DNA helicase PcrA